MVSRTVARRYSKGLLGAVVETVGEEGLHAARDELRGLADLVRGHGGLRLLIANPAVHWKDKASVMERLAEQAGLHELTRRFVAQLAHKERLDHLEAIADVFGELVDEHLGVLGAEVTAPTPLDEGAAEELREKLAAATGKEVRLTTSTDPEVLGGLVTRIGDIVYDGSLKTHLSRIRERMVAGQK